MEKYKTPDGVKLLMLINITAVYMVSQYAHSCGMSALVITTEGKQFLILLEFFFKHK